MTQTREKYSLLGVFLLQARMDGNGGEVALYLGCALSKPGAVQFPKGHG